MSRKTDDDPDAAPHPDDWGPRTFTKTGFSAYRLALDRGGITLDLTHMRRERHELIGELCVRCNFAGARTVQGVLHIADFNLSSAQARSTRAKILAGRALTKDVDWEGLLQEICQYTLAAERGGDPPQLLADVPIPAEDEGDFHVSGLSIPKTHPTMMFGDGGAAKSLFGLHLACSLAAQGQIVAYFDWEADAGVHRSRLAKMYPIDPPPVLYVRCERPLVQESDRLRSLVVDNGVTYTIMDSAAYGCAGAPESAEAALDYFRAIRSLGPLGHFIIAHVNRSEEGDKKPFGSSFWHNSARATFHVRRSNPDESSDIYTLVTPRKCNFGKLKPASSYCITFSDRITIERTSIDSADEFAPHIPFAQRLYAALRKSSMTREEISRSFPDEKADTIRKTVNRALSRASLIAVPSVDGERISIKSGSIMH